MAIKPKALYYNYYINYVLKSKLHVRGNLDEENLA